MKGCHPTVNVMPNTKTSSSRANADPSVFPSPFIPKTSCRRSRRQTYCVPDPRQYTPSSRICTGAGQGLLPGTEAAKRSCTGWLWLAGPTGKCEEAPAPARADQHESWRELRKLLAIRMQLRLLRYVLARHVSGVVRPGRTIGPRCVPNRFGSLMTFPQKPKDSIGRLGLQLREPKIPLYEEL